MDQIKELRTLKDLCDHGYEMVWNGRAPLFLYQCIKDVDGLFQRGTLLLALVSSNLSACSLDPRNPSRSVKINVYYEMKPGETEFKKTFYDLHGRTIPWAFTVKIFQDARLFYLGDIGKEISESFTPEDAARKYFGSSDFSKIFSYISNRDYFNKRKSLEYAANLGLIPRYTESALARIPLLGTHHPVKPIKPTFQKYWDAWDEVALTDSDSQRQWDAASNDLHRGMSAVFGTLSLLPSVYNKKKKTDYAQKRIQEMEFVPASERSKSLTKGALSTRLMQRLSYGQSDKIKTFGTLHNRVHSQSKPSGGSKKHKSRKTLKTRH